MHSQRRTARRIVGLGLAVALAVGCSSPSKGLTPLGKNPTPSIIESSAVVDDLPEVSPDPREPALAEIATVLLTEKHLLRRPIDDALSREAFPKYIEELDGAKLLLLQSDVDKLSAYSDRMDDELRGHNLVLARKGAALAAQRREVVAKLVADTLAKPFDFAANEQIETDVKKRAFCNSEAELANRWRGVLKLQVLERLQQMDELLASGGKIDGKEDPAAMKALGSIPQTPEAREEKARQELATRYATRFTRLASAEPLEPATLFLNAVTAAYDPHTQYMAPAEKENFDIAISGKLEGIGAALGEQDHYVAVQELIPGGAAWKEGNLEAGDLIIAVAQAGKDAVDVTDMPIDKVVEMIRGPAGTVVILTVKKPEGDIKTISIKRDVVRIEAAYARAAILGSDGPNPIGYIFLPSFYGDISGPRKPGERNATDDVRALLVELQKHKVKGVIIDLRGNGGGLLSHARDISGLFIDRGPVVQARDSNGKLEIFTDEDPSVTFDGNVVVMIDRFSASASEILAGALQDYERAVIVGTTTHGKGTVQGVLELDNYVQVPGGDSLGVFKLTVQQFFRVNGASTQWRGVVPDVVLPDPASFVESGERTLFHSIPWTSVEPLPYRHQGHAWKIADLVAKSRDRVSAHALFGKVSSFGKLVEAKRKDTIEPLERTAWLARKKLDKEALDAADPKLKDQKGLFAVEVVADAATAAQAAKDDKLRKKLDEWKDELARDPWIDESMHVLADMGGAP
jgi:carboxyl-terminal processing protease